MKTSESIKNLTKALLKAQSQMGAAVKGAKNPFFKSSYADLPTVMEVVKAPLNENGLLILQPTSHRDGKNFIDTVIIHGETGEFVSSETEVICAKQNDPQAFGAAQTYARRFGLQAMGFIPCDDDDGNAASGRTVSKPAYTKPQTDPKALAQATAAPATTNEVARDEAPVTAASTTETTPAKKSSFRKTPTIPKVEATATTTEQGW